MSVPVGPEPPKKAEPQMKIHEYQAKAILARYGVTTPRGEVAFTKEEAREAAQRLKTPVVVVKAQIHAGGRGKAGGVKLARSADEAAELASQILGMTLITPQTGPQGRVVRRLLIEEGLDIRREKLRSAWGFPASWLRWPPPFCRRFIARSSIRMLRCWRSIPAW